MTTISVKPHRETGKPHWVEWLTGLVSAILIVAMLGWVGWEAVSEDDMAPEFGIEITARSAVEGGYRVEFDIINTATRTAAAVMVRGEMRDGDNVIEQADISFDYVPAQSKASGALFFTHDPDQAQLTIRAIGYTDP